jgi:hypothetical protein
MGDETALNMDPIMNPDTIVVVINSTRISSSHIILNVSYWLSFSAMFYGTICHKCLFLIIYLTRLCMVCVSTVWQWKGGAQSHLVSLHWNKANSFPLCFIVQWCYNLQVVLRHIIRQSFRHSSVTNQWVEQSGINIISCDTIYLAVCSMSYFVVYPWYWS